MFQRTYFACGLAACILSLAAIAPAAANAPAAALAAQPAAKVFSAVKTPSAGESQPIGFYSKGCLAGAVAMPLAGPDWQVLHPQRNRNWGMPEMIAYLKDLAKNAKAIGWNGLLIGDIAQPRGGPLSFGHSAHQIGLDADIWLTPMPKGGLSAAALRDMDGGSVLKDNSLYLDPQKWSESHTELLKLAAADPNVERIFVHPGIKKYLCDNAGDKIADIAWLGKLRPYWGHYEHFHVRLKCPPEAKDCQSQLPPPKGTGCDSALAWWFTREAWKPKKKPRSFLTFTSPAQTKPKITAVGDLPPRCLKLLQQ